MSRPEKMTESECRDHLRQLSSEWSLRDAKLCREFRFGDFREAFAFMTLMAFTAEKMDHHPDWSNVYNRVSVQLNTHDAGGVTALDFQMAEEMDRAFAQIKGD